MVILDIEASGLHDDSYPIQVAWLNPKTGEEDSFYITPEDEWTYWDENAEEIHKIPRERLYQEGIPADLAVRRILNKLGDDIIVYSDAPEFDGFWLSRLFETVELEPHVNVNVHGVHTLCETHAQLEAMITIMMHQKRSHDALDDCRKIWEAVCKSKC